MADEAWCLFSVISCAADDDGERRLPGRHGLVAGAQRCSGDHRDRLQTAHPKEFWMGIEWGRMGCWEGMDSPKSPMSSPRPFGVQTSCRRSLSAGCANTIRCVNCTGRGSGLPHDRLRIRRGDVAIQSFSILVASVLVQGGIATNAVDRPLRYNQRRSWLPIIVFCTKNMGYFLVVRSP